MTVILRAKIEAARPVLRGHDHFWRTILKLTAEDTAGGFTAYAVAMASSPGVEPDIRDFVRRLVRAGIAYRGDDGRTYLKQRGRETPRLKRDGSEAPQWRGRQHMWNVMRRSVGGFTIKELSIDATTDTVRVTEPAAQQYCLMLVDAGVLVIANPGRKRGDATVYRLTGSGNTGPLAPKRLQVTMLWDPNTEQVLGADRELQLVEEDRP